MTAFGSNFACGFGEAGRLDAALCAGDVAAGVAEVERPAFAWSLAAASVALPWFLASCFAFHASSFARRLACSSSFDGPGVARLL